MVDALAGAVEVSVHPDRPSRAVPASRRPLDGPRPGPVDDQHAKDAATARRAPRAPEPRGDGRALAADRFRTEHVGHPRARERLPHGLPLGPGRGRRGHGRGSRLPAGAHRAARRGKGSAGCGRGGLGADDPGRRVRLRLRALASQGVPRTAGRAHLSHAARGLLLRRRPGRRALPLAGHAGVGGLRGARTSTARSNSAPGSRSRRTATAPPSIRTRASAWSRHRRWRPSGNSWPGASPASRTRRSCRARCASTRTRPTATS